MHRLLFRESYNTYELILSMVQQELQNGGIFMCLLSVLFGGKNSSSNDDLDWIDEMEEIEAIIEEEEE